MKVDYLPVQVFLYEGSQVAAQVASSREVELSRRRCTGLSHYFFTKLLTYRVM